MAQNETLERDLFTKTELLRTVEDQHRMFVKKLKDDYKLLEQKQNHQNYCKDIEYEDLRSYTRRLFDNFK